jgi:hypothetical protein
MPSGLGRPQVPHEIHDAVQLVGLECQHPLVVSERERSNGVRPDVRVVPRQLAMLGQKRSAFALR